MAASRSRPSPPPRPVAARCPRAASPRAAWQFASSSSSSLRSWPPPPLRSPSLSTAFCPRKRPGPPPFSVATRSMTGEGCSSPSWTRGLTPVPRACRCGSRGALGRGRPAGPGVLEEQLPSLEVEARSEAERDPGARGRQRAERARRPGGVPGARGLQPGHPGWEVIPAQTKAVGAAGRVSGSAFHPGSPYLPRRCQARALGLLPVTLSSSTYPSCPGHRPVPIFK